MSVSFLERTSRILLEERLSKFVGVVRIPIKSMVFVPNFKPSDYDINVKNVSRLKKAFAEEGCDRLNPRHRISGTVGSHSLQEAMQHSGLARENLHTKEPLPLLFFPLGSFVSCANGRSRVNAFVSLYRSYPAADQWWAVELYEDLSQNAFEALEVDFENENNFSDGYIAYKILENRRDNNRSGELRWWARLSSSKANILRRLMKHSLADRVFKTLEIPGMRDGVHLAIIKNIIASKQDEEYEHALERLYRCWVFIMGSVGDLQRVDTQTVLCLESRAPGVSQSDYHFLSWRIQHGLILKGIEDEQEKENILGRLRCIKFLIPSIHTIQQHCKYLRPCGDILRRLFIGDDQKPLSYTIRELAAEAFGAGEQIDRKYSSPIFLHRLKLLYIHVMRNLVALSGEHCLLEKDEPSKMPLALDQGAWTSLAKRAEELDFKTTEITHLCLVDPDREILRKAFLEARKPEDYTYNELELEDFIKLSIDFLNRAKPCSGFQPPEMILTSENGEALSRRCGRQYSAAYARDRHYYMPSVINMEVQEGPDVTSLFVWRSMFLTFWGPFDSMDRNTGRVRSDSRPPDCQSNSSVDVEMRDGVPVRSHVERPGDSGAQSQTTDVAMTDSQQRKSSQRRETKVIKPTATARKVESENKKIVSRALELFAKHSPSEPKARAQQLAHTGADTLKVPIQASTSKLVTASQSQMPVVSATAVQQPNQSSTRPPSGHISLSRSNQEISVFLQDEVTLQWELRGPYPRTHITEAVTDLVDDLQKASSKQWYIFHSSERGIIPLDCQKLNHDTESVCITANKNGFSGKPPPQMEL